jgi:phosphate/sulfate permease
MAPLNEYLWIAVLGGILGFVYGFLIGANDVANAFASSIASKSITLKQAVCESVHSINRLSIDTYWY